jgi:hypothetical protein
MSCPPVQSATRQLDSFERNARRTGISGVPDWGITVSSHRIAGFVSAAILFLLRLLYTLLWWLDYDAHPQSQDEGTRYQIRGRAATFRPAYAAYCAEQQTQYQDRYARRAKYRYHWEELLPRSAVRHGGWEGLIQALARVSAALRDLIHPLSASSAKSVPYHVSTSRRLAE